MMEEKIKVSVIIPVYNVEDYIEKCLESVVNQTLKEIEIIVVNDGTKDNSIKKIEKYFSDSRIKIINKQNGGLSSARNAGLEIAKGEYISFIDSDDFIEEKMLEELYNESENADIVFSNNLNYNMLDNKLSKEEREFFFDKMSNKGSYICMYSSAVVWNKIYKRDFLEKNNLKFIEGIIHEDDIFTIKSHFLAKKVKYVKKFHYYYRINRRDSIMSNKVKNKHLENYKVIYEQVREFYDNFNGTNFEKLRLYLLKSYYLIFRMRLEGNVNKIEITDFENNFKKCYSELKLSRLEKRIIEDDVKRVLKNREYSYINLLDSFYWKNNLLIKKFLEELLKKK